MPETNELFDSLLSAYRSADDPDRFLRELLMRLDDATTNTVVATERRLERLDAARERLEAARSIPRPGTEPDIDDEEPEEAEEPPKSEQGEPEADEAPEDDEVEEPPRPKKTRAKKAARSRA